MSAEENETPNFPPEIADDFKTFHNAFAKAEEQLFPLMTFKISSTDVKLNPVDKARLHVTCAYALNSFFWMYLKTCGIDTKEHKIKDEMARIKEYLKKLQELDDRKKAPHLNREAAQRFIQSSLWQPRENRSTGLVGGSRHNKSKHSNPKRKSDDHGGSHKKKKKT